MASDGETWCANDPNFAVIYSFLKVFGKLYGLEVPTIAKLQESIEDTQEVSETLKELHLRLLRRALKSVHSNRWEKGMIKFCHQQGHHQEAWEIERFSYKKASTLVKLKVLKILLEYQFTCYPKFKSAVNAISCKELRLDPIGRDQNGCAYWLQVDNDANICLYKEDQDEETWQLIARNREEFVKVIGQLKSGEEISPSQTSNANEDSSGAENHVQELQSEVKPETNSRKPEVVDDENEEEFLSPESESEQEETEHIDPLSDAVDGNGTTVESSDPLDSKDAKEESTDPVINKQIDDKPAVNETEVIVTEKQTENKNTQAENNERNVEVLEAIIDNVIEKSEEDELLRSPESEKSEQSEDILQPSEKIHDRQAVYTTETSTNEIDKKNADPVPELETKVTEPDHDVKTFEETPNSPKPSETSNNSESILEDDNNSTINQESKSEENLQNEEVSEAIEEPVMLVTGEGNGADCESFFIGEEISEPVMFFYGEGYGYENDTGNPEAIEETNQPEAEEENGKEEVVNGEHEVIKTKSKLGKNVRLKTVNKRSLKKQPNDTNDAKPDTKKPCVRDMDKSHNSKVDNCLKRDANINDKSTTDSESQRKNIIKKGRTKVKKKAVRRKLKLKRNSGKDKAINSVETDNCQDKTSIIEKRKSSVSSVEQEDNPTENEKEKTPDKDLKVEDPLPTKKIRLETAPESDINATHSKNVVSESNDKDNSNHDPVSNRKKIKARKGKFKRKVQDLDKSNNIDNVNDSPKKSNKSLKRTLIAEPMSDKNKSESQSESEDDEPITSGKRLKIKPKKIITSSRKKVEAKLLEKNSSDESEEETLYSLAGKKSTKKLKKKPKGKSKDKDKKAKSKTEKTNSDDSDAPVRQSRRIAQQKIKEEAERRHLEEVALRELKMIHKKKSKDDDEEEWRASGRSSSEPEAKPKHRRTWRASDSTGPEPDSESDSPLFELQPEPEPEHDYGKSDHEFSPESDLETGESPEPLKRARTLQEEKDDGFCKRCGSAEQPEWILLCDSCDAGYHASCLKPMLFVVPEGDWFCPPCNHDKLIKTLESELVKYDKLLARVEEERARKKLEEPVPPPEEEKKDKSEADSDGSSDSSWSSSSDDAAVYRLRARRQLPVSVRGQEYDRIISAAIKEEYVEPTTSAGNQGRGKDISTIIEAAEEEKMKAEREAIEQGKPLDMLKKLKRKQRRKPRKLNSLEVPSEDDDETDEDFKDVGGASSSEDISSSADKESGDSRSSDSLPIRRTGRTDKKDRPKLRESSPETKKKKKVFDESSSESAGAKEWNSSKPKSKSHSHSKKRNKREKRDKSKKSRSRGLTQYDAEGNVIRARVTYGGLSGEEGENDWSPKHRTRQKKINYTEMPNTESEDEMHKSSGKHMPDSSDEFKCSDSEFDTDSDSERTKKRREEENAEREKALSDLVKKTAVVPLEKLPEDVTKAKTEELQAHLSKLYAQQASARPHRGKGSRGGRGSRGPRGRGGSRSSSARASSPQTDDALAKLVGVKIKELGQDGSPVKASQLEREKKRQEREAKLAEKEAKKLERLQKKEEKDKLKEQKAKEREEKKLARLALQESKRIKKEKEYMAPMGGYGVPVRPLGAESPRINNMNMFNHMRPQRPTGPGGPGPPGPDGPDRFPNTPRLQVRAELRGVVGDHRTGLTREGTLSVAGSPQPFKPVSEEPSIITRMPHMINQQYRGPMMYGPGAGGAANYAARQGAPGGMYGLHGLRYPPHYYRLPPYSAPPATTAQHHQPPPLYSHMQGPGGPPTSMHPSQGSLHHSGGYYRAAPPGAMPPGAPGPSSSPAGSPMGTPGPHSMPGHQHHMMGPHNVPGGQFLPRSPGPNPSSGAPTPPGALNTAPGGLAPGSMPPRLLGPGGPGGAPGPPVGPGSQLSSQEAEPPIRIKAEVKTEPEYRSPVGSPGAGSPGEPREEPPRHPKIKVTEVRERRPRFPLGPYAPHLAPYRPYAPPLHAGPPGPGSHHPGPGQLHPGPSSHHPGQGTHPGPGLHHPGPSSHHPGPSSHHPGQSPHHPGPGPHPVQGPSPHHPGPNPHHPGQIPHHPGPSPHHPGPIPHHSGQSPHPVSSPHHPTQSPHNSAQSPHHPGSSSHPGQGSHHPGQNIHHSGQSPHQPGPNTHHPGTVPHQQGQSPHQSGPAHNSGPLPHRPGQSPQHPGPSSHHPGQSPQHPGPSPHHLGQNLNHPGPIPSHQGTPPHPLQLRDPSQFKTERDQSPPPTGTEERSYPPGAGRGFPPGVRSPFPPGGPTPYPRGGPSPYPPGTTGSYPPNTPGSYPPSTTGSYAPGSATGPHTGMGPGYPPGVRFPPNAGRGFPPGVRPFPPQFQPRPHLPTSHSQPIAAHSNAATQPSQPPQAKSPLAVPPRAPSHSPHPPSAHVKPAGRGSMPFPARTASPVPPVYATQAQSPRESKTQSPQPPADRSPPYYGDRRAVVPPLLAPRGTQEGSGSPSRVPQQRLESLEAAPSPGAESPPRVKLEREEGSVFGGLVSYFSSQHEDDMDG